jgi:MerR family copper efflux transcriptional regulator
MKIGELAAAAGVSTDTVRYYEKQCLLDPPARAANGYRSYRAQHLERIAFIRSAQALGFSLAHIAHILPQLAAGQFGRAEIEGHLQTKMAEIDVQIRALQALKRELHNTFERLTCRPDAVLSAAEATANPAPSAVGRKKRPMLANG